MLNRYLLSGCIIGSAMVMIASPAIARKSLSPKEVARIAKSTIVQIAPTANFPGSGVIIGTYKENNSNVYIVLTANHVVQYKDDEYQITTPFPLEGDKRRQKISISTSKDIQRLPGVDLAVVKFRSAYKFNTATLGDSGHTTEGSGIYVAGFPNPGQAIKKYVFQFTSGLVSSRLDDNGVGVEEDTAVENGYAIAYTAITGAGMSGGPVFDVSGRVVGIHGRGDREKNPNDPKSSKGNQESGSESGPEKKGFNLAIPVEIFLKTLDQNVISKSGIKLDKSEPGRGEIYRTRGRNSNNSFPVDDPTISTYTETTEEPADAVAEVVSQSSKNRTSSPLPPLTIPTRTQPNQNPAPGASSPNVW